jgi:hypothetical protein
MKRSLPAFIIALAALAAASVAFAGDDVTSLSYISYVERYATLNPAQNQETLDAVVNMPVLTGDRLDTSRGARVEVQLADGSTVWVDEFSTLDFDAIALSRDNPADKTALYLSQGTVGVEIPPTAGGDGAMRLDSPAGTLYLDRPGLYRVDLSGNEVHVQSYTGLAELPVGVGSALLRGGEEATLDQGGDLQKAALSESTDDFWNWVQELREPASSGVTAEHVDARDASRAAVLDNYGDWVYVPTFSSWMWRPRVAVGWIPYSYGRWSWTPVGWDWISYEPWGWYPFHYGSWYLSGEFGWVWGWDSVWSPAWVYWMYTPGYVGWCPRGYYDWWYYHHYRGEAGHRFPSRWRDVTFDFSGRVRPGRVDPHPWTFVPTSQFNSTNVERARLNPDRFLRGLPGDSVGIVRSGPLLTRGPSRGSPERGIESFFRSGTSERAVPDLTSVLRREPATGPRAATVGPILNPRRTGDVTAVPRVRVAEPVVRIDREGGSGRIVIRNNDGQASRDGARAFRPRVDRSQVRPQGSSSNPPPVGRREVERPVGNIQRATPRTENTRPERPPAAPRQRNDSASWVRERQFIQRREETVNRGAQFQAQVGRAAQVRSYERPYVASPRMPARSWESPRVVQPNEGFRARSWESPRVVQPREGFRTWNASSASAPAVRSTPSRSMSSRSFTPRSSSAPRSVGRGGGGGHPRR